MTSVRANGVDLGIESFGSDDDPLILLVGGPTMLSWPDALCDSLASAGRRVVRCDLRDSGESTTLDLVTRTCRTTTPRSWLRCSRIRCRTGPIGLP
jgi:pimeloyl-ACP methyl ester carboxylesterase